MEEFEFDNLKELISAWTTEALKLGDELRIIEYNVNVPMRKGNIKIFGERLNRNWKGELISAEKLIKKATKRINSSLEELDKLDWCKGKKDSECKPWLTVIVCTKNRDFTFYLSDVTKF